MVIRVRPRWIESFHRRFGSTWCSSVASMKGTLTWGGDAARANFAGLLPGLPRHLALEESLSVVACAF